MDTDTIAVEQQDLDAVLEEYFREVHALNWENPDEVHRVTTPLLVGLARNKPLLLAMIDRVPGEPKLFDRCESDGFLHKVVLYENPTRTISVKLHTVLPVEHDRPHDHRSTFTSLILRGGYLHTIYNAPPVYAEDDDDGKPQLPDNFFDLLQPLTSRQEVPGSVYTIHHNAFHSTIADAEHMSLVIRGPAAKKRLLYIDEERNEVRWFYSSALESAEEIEAKRLSLDTWQVMRDRVAEI